MKRYKLMQLLRLQLVVFLFYALISAVMSQLSVSQAQDDSDASNVIAECSTTFDESAPARMRLGFDDKGEPVGYSVVEKGGARYRTYEPFSPLLGPSPLQKIDSLKQLPPDHTIATWVKCKNGLHVYTAATVYGQPGRLRFELTNLTMPDGRMNTNPTMNFSSKSGLFLLKNDLLIPKTSYKIPNGRAVVVKDNTIIGILGDNGESIGLMKTEDERPSNKVKIEVKTENQSPPASYIANQSNSDDQVEKLIETLKKDSQYFKWDAAKKLGKIKDIRAVDPLIKALKDESLDVRWAASESLGEIGDKRAIEPLKQLFKQESLENIKNVIAEALKKLTETRK